MNKERYLVIYPSGVLQWILVDRKQLSDSFRKAIGCARLENVFSVLPGICLIIDEVGKVSDSPQTFNPIASKFYAGSPYGDYIAGPAVIAAMHILDGEIDWVPPSVPELLKLQSFLGVDFSSAIEVDI